MNAVANAADRRSHRSQCSRRLLPAHERRWLRIIGTDDGALGLEVPPTLLARRRGGDLCNLAAVHESGTGTSRHGASPHDVVANGAKRTSQRQIYACAL
jgi:hypothetical protein